MKNEWEPGGKEIKNAEVKSYEQQRSASSWVMLRTACDN